ncbi:hypothetical protein [Methanolobus psychrotolerans]|uniref:hypothetical protein n=1 Tax=Methanolobus psychrotolerans TaxID=1874706 RepID=UPI000B916654|nr:hypothetical protein [Methanolobus psychrotolerans]
MAIFFNFQSKCPNCEDIHPSKVEITEAELIEMFRDWVINHEDNLEVYCYGEVFVATTNQKVISDYTNSVGGEISVAIRVDSE